MPGIPLSPPSHCHGCYVAIPKDATAAPRMIATRIGPVASTADHAHYLPASAPVGTALVNLVFRDVGRRVTGWLVLNSRLVRASLAPLIDYI